MEKHRVSLLYVLYTSMSIPCTYAINACVKFNTQYCALRFHEGSTDTWSAIHAFTKSLKVSKWIVSTDLDISCGRGTYILRWKSGRDSFFVPCWTLLELMIHAYGDTDVFIMHNENAAGVTYMWDDDDVDPYQLIACIPDDGEIIISWVDDASEHV